MRILFIYPNLYTQMGFNHGLASLSAVLKDSGHVTRLVNLNENLPPVPSDEQIFDDLLEWSPGLVGFSCLTMQYAEAVRIATDLRRRARDCGRSLPPFVVGGIHPTMVPEEVMADGVWDYVGVGECEDALLELVQATEAGQARDDIPNFLAWKDAQRPAEADRCWREGGQALALERARDLFRRNPVGEFPNFRDMPIPDYELFETQRILDQKHGWFGLMTSRGCPYRCTYCLNHRVVDTYRADLGRGTSDIGFFRYRSPEKMVEEIRFVLAKYTGVGTFILDDDLFTMNAPHAQAFAKAYGEAGFDVPWVVNSHVKRLDPDLATGLFAGGCRILKLGIESGSERVRRDVLKRFMGDDDILETVHNGEAAGLHTSGFVMIGLPTETQKERWETVDLLARSRIGRFRTSLFFPFPGTESHALAIKEGYVTEEEVGSLTEFTASSCLDFGERENLFIEKLTTCMPWFVNARLDRFGPAPASDRYSGIAAEVLRMDRATWDAFLPGVRERDAELSAAAVKAHELHYAIRFNAFMGVRSDWFLAEDGGVEWATAASKPVPDRLRDLALAAAADEVC